MFVTPPPRDQENNILQGYISGIPNVLNITCLSGVWTEINSPYETKELLIQSRGSVTWYFSNDALGLTYFSFYNGAAWKANIASVSGTIGYVSTEQNTVIEVLIGV